ncbi:phage terminase large subunit GpA-like protein [Thalassospira sp. 11-3]|nr:phage terminase large subunit GpA-like protein [Thalassospira sp. 11-3]
MQTSNDIMLSKYLDIHEKIYDFKTVKILPSVWTEENVRLGSDISRYTGPFRYDKSPYTREIINNLSPTDPTETTAVIKCAQSGLTQGVIIPGICYIISENPGPILFMAGDKELARNSVRTRLDPVIESSGIGHLIRPNVIRKKNQRTGDTDFSKEFAGGQLIVEGTKNADKMRQFSVRYIFADDWEAAPRDDKKEGSVRKLVEGRSTSFGNMRKLFYISTPAVKQTSNIEPVYEMGDQRKWHWKCPHCKKYIPMEWRVKKEDGTYAGIKYELDQNGLLNEKSVHYECQYCGGKILERDKFNLNLAGKWIATAKPVRPNIRSYYLNALIIPPGFTSWVDLVYEWIEANPKDGVVDIGKLKTFLNIRLGQTWTEHGETPRVNELMKNICSYNPGTVPDITAAEHGNGDIIMLTLACDLNGIMEKNNQDVRLDWELVAHTTTGAWYSVDHGSIGTFKRERDKTKFERETDGDREKWTYNHGHKNSVWPVFEELMRKKWPCETPDRHMEVMLTTVDTGYFTRLANQFIEKFDDLIILGIKGAVETDYRRVQKDTAPVRQSRENKGLYILEVNQIKDELSSYIKLVEGSDGYQPPGFMNFPQPQDGKYNMVSYFQHYEGERRVEETKDGVVVGFKWEKKNSQSLNHFWDVRVYNIAARYIYLDLIARSEKNINKLSWAELVAMISN